MELEEFIADINSEKYIYLEDLHEDDRSLVIELAGTTSSPSTEDELADLREEFGDKIAGLAEGCNSIEVNEDRRWRLRFDNYTAYAVINESYDNGDRATMQSTSPVDVVDDSDWLDYVNKSTFAFQIFDSIKHYQIACLDQIINVASDRAPKIEKL